MKREHSKEQSPNIEQKLRQPGIEPGASVWETEILPLNHWRLIGIGAHTMWLNTEGCLLNEVFLFSAHREKLTEMGKYFIGICLSLIHI